MDISLEELNVRFLALGAQRNEALDKLVVLQGLLAVKENEIEKLKKQLEELKQNDGATGTTDK